MRYKIPQVGIYQYLTSNPNKIPDDKVIYVDGVTGKGYTFGEFKHESKRFAAGLQDKLEFNCGDVLAMFSPNKVDYPIAVLGTIAAGGKVTTVNPKYEATDLSYQLTDSGASVLIVHPEILEVAIEALINAEIPTSRVLLFGDKEIKGYKPYRSVLINNREIEPIHYTPEEVKSTAAYLVYSSGTTGTQKGVEITHTSAIVRSAQAINVECKLGSHSKTMAVLGHCHSFGLARIIQATLIHQFDLSSVDAIICGAAPLNAKLERKFYEMFKIPILQIYGLTEAGIVLQCPNATVPGSVGILYPNMKAKILSDDGRELEYNEPGELWIHGPNVMKGYLNNKEATDVVFDKTRFFNTGDIVSVDEQGIFFMNV
ncbi:acetyl-CoA synthetase-like protein [Gigaspora margarita]|uniref:Acetyl-CoA synthetase-like protein n=1 Tax=Gigaspora margarita TaxID=4874 RepID=A0A8H4A9C5_GIGMA|nr:acetyl-CoA synthetase-like protein [Gigaspora margarita]